MRDEASKYLGALEDILDTMGSVLVAFSGGVDSTFLLRVAVSTLGKNVLAVTATSSTYPTFELTDAIGLAEEMDVEHLVIESEELDIPQFRENPPNRCYFCKKELFGKLLDISVGRGINHVLDGSNKDDLDDFRPGRLAAEELGVRSPLVEAGIGKDLVREISKALGLTTWEKGSFACLSSRFPFGNEITVEALGKIESCEDFLRSAGFRQFRVRYHDNMARIEVGEEEIDRLISSPFRTKIAEHFKKAGFTFVSLDLEGYRTGSMNVTAKKPEK